MQVVVCSLVIVAVTAQLVACSDSIAPAHPEDDSTGGGAATGGAVPTDGDDSHEPGTSGGAGGASSGGTAGLPAATWPLVNGVQWADTDGEPIQAHGGGVLEEDGYFYWFGENRNPDGTFFAVTAYRSHDLVQWERVHDVLTSDSHPELDPANVERPKVVKNEATGKYVMWMHWENGSDYGEARAAVASGGSIAGDYTFHGSFRPYADEDVIDHGRPGYMSRDCTLFVDDDGAGYFLSATNENYDLNLYALSADYLEIDHLVATLFPGGHREAPALFKRGDVYFLLTSGATGWNPNQAQYATSTNLASGWSSMQNVADGNTFHSQPTFVLPITRGGVSTYLYLGDRWAGAYGGRVNDSAYVWQPLAFPTSTAMSMSWSNVLAIDVPSASITGSVERFRVVNVGSGLALDVAEASTNEGADIVQMPVSESESQVWSLNYNGRGHFRLTNQLSELVLDVPDESTADGIALIQWQDLDGDNQGFRPIDVGRGRYHLRNQNSEKLVGVVTGSTEAGAGATIEQRAATGGDEQLWELRPANYSGAHLR